MTFVIFYGACVLLVIPVLVLFTQILLSTLNHEVTSPEVSGGHRRSLRAAVLIPAHDEKEVICAVLRDMQKQMLAVDRILVVADNCTDDTAALARACGAEVIERCDERARGKGYALDYGIRHLSANPPDVVVVLDADCRMGPGSLDVLVNTADHTGRPVQALDIMKAPSDSGFQLVVSEFAWRIKNWARPLGWSKLGWPCQLMGTGMAFPWSIAKKMALANGHLAEDMKLGAELAVIGLHPLFCPQAVVTSEFPAFEQARKSQRVRWEHGHMNLLLGLSPRLLWCAIKTRNMLTMAMALDLMVPPVSLLAVLLGVLWTLSWGFVFLADATGPLLLTTSMCFVFSLTLWIAVRRWGHDLADEIRMSRIIGYMIAKLPLYFSYLYKPQKNWVKTSRKPSEN